MRRKRRGGWIMHEGSPVHVSGDIDSITPESREALNDVLSAAKKTFAEMEAAKMQLRVYKGATKGSETRALMQDFKVPPLVIQNVTTPPGNDAKGKPVQHKLTLGPATTCRGLVVAQVSVESPDHPTTVRTVPEEVEDLHEWEGRHRAQGWR